MDRLIAAVTSLSHHEHLEVASWVSQIVLAIVGVLTAFLVLAQVRQIANDSSKQTLQLKANFLFELDKLFESDAFRESRLLVVQNHDAIMEEIRNEAPGANGVQRRALCAEKFCALLNRLKKNDLPQYQRIMKVPGFFETAGKLAHSGYIDAYDIFELYRNAMTIYYDATSKHILERRTSEEAPDLYEHFLTMAQEHTPAKPRRRGCFWRV